MEPFIDVLQIFLSKSKVLYISVEDFKKEILFNLLRKDKLIKIKQIQLTVSSYEKLKFIR
ncbi:MAG: hypothetical protein PHE32_04045 [Candidatus Shapirobacteria bacterium]|nr:hypothetical protein [Candidatus Shapirobacteria bacterium]